MNRQLTNQYIYQYIYQSINDRRPTDRPTHSTRWDPKSSTLELIGFHDPRVYVVSLSVIKKRFVLVGDMFGSVQASGHLLVYCFFGAGGDHGGDGDDDGNWLVLTRMLVVAVWKNDVVGSCYAEIGNE